MTKKIIVEIAEIIKNLPREEKRDSVEVPNIVDAFCAYLKKKNPLFDENRFRTFIKKES